MDPDSNNLIIHLVILLVLILINAFFAMSEIAIVTFNDNKLKRMACLLYTSFCRIVQTTAAHSGAQGARIALVSYIKHNLTDFGSL